MLYFGSPVYSGLLPIPLSKALRVVFYSCSLPVCVAGSSDGDHDR